MIILILNTIISSLVFLLLVMKARIRVKSIYTDNILIISSATLFGLLIENKLMLNRVYEIVLVSVVVTLSCIVFLIIFRFYRNPERHHNAADNDILSPADGFVIYITRVESGEIPFSTKGGNKFKINVLSKVDIIRTPCWLIGITMTLFDVHYVRSPIRGEVVLNQYTEGKFLSLKRVSSEVENERNTIVVENNQCQIGVIEIASKRVRGIRTYVQRGQRIQMGQRIGMMTFGSQTDVIFPADAVLRVKTGEWVYGGKTIIASFDI